MSRMYPPQKPFVSLHTLAQWLTILFVVVIVIDVIGVFSDIAEISLLSKINAGKWVSDSEVTASDTRQAAIGVIWLLVFIAITVVFLIWIYRAHRNLSALGVQNLRFSPGWAAGWFFIPIMSLFRPYQVVTEIWKGSDPKSTDGVSWQSVPLSPLIGWWWAFWIIGNFISNFAARLFLTGETTGLASSWCVLIADVIEIPAAILAIAIIRRISVRQQENGSQAVKFAPQASGDAFVSGSLPRVQSPAAFCVVCGRKFEDSDRFCRKCGGRR